MDWNVSEFRPLGSVLCVSNSGNRERIKNISAALAMGLKKLKPSTVQRLVPLSIIGGGPSLKQTFKNISGDTLVCGSAHDAVVRLGIRPTYAIECDPCLEQIEYYKLNPPGCKYLVATRCHETMFIHLRRRDVYTWNLLEGDLDLQIFKRDHVFRGGSSAFICALSLGVALGYSRFKYYGIDSSFPSKEEHHAYGAPDWGLKVLTAKVGDPVNGKEFLTTALWMSQAQEYQKMATFYGHLFKGKFYGNGMLAEMERVAGRQ